MTLVNACRNHLLDPCIEAFLVADGDGNGADDDELQDDDDDDDDDDELQLVIEA
jgi:hypothetical protein